MGSRDPEVDVLGGGTRVESPSKGTYVHNMLHRRGAWEVREGFGQRVQYTTTLSNAGGLIGFDWGYQRHLGSYLMRTRFGHRQIISAFHLQGNTASSSFRNVNGDFFAISIHDITTDERWEEVIVAHTGESAANVVFAEAMHGHYETNETSDYTSFVAGCDEEWWFEEYRDMLWMGSPSAGVMVYFPADFSGARPRFVDSVNSNEWAQGYSETAMLVRVPPLDGLAPEATTYRTKDDSPPTVDMASLGARVVRASEREIMFSDVGFPAAFDALNFITLDAESAITAIAEHEGNLIVWTERETWYYQPSNGYLASQGLQPTRLSSNVGCLGPNCNIRVEGATVWLDVNGVWSLDSNLLIRQMSKDIDPFFSDFITSPLSSFIPSQTDPGHTDLVAEQPRTVLRLDAMRAHLTYSPFLRCLFVAQPTQRMAWCMSENGQWSVWSFESVVNTVGGRSVPGLTANIEEPWLLAGLDDFCMVGGIDEQVMASFAPDIHSRSYYVLEYGRGGGIDRSTADEDQRVLSGNYLKLALPLDTGRVYLERWLRVPAGYVFPGGFAVTATAEVYLIPMYLSMADGALTQPTDVDIRFTFDNSVFIPVLAAGSNIDAILPTERLASAPGYTNGVGLIQLFDVGTGLPDAAGDQVRIRFDGAAAPATWTHHPDLNCTPGRKDPFMYIPVIKFGTGASVGFVTGRSATIVHAPDPAETYTFIVWSPGFFASDGGAEARRINGAVAQPVDWAYKTDNITAGNASRFKARGMRVRMLSHGQGAHRITGDWVYGLYNTVMGSDKKQWISQIIFYTSEPPSLAEVIAKSTIRSRVLGADGAIRSKVFNTAAPSNLTYGDPAVRATGNFLIDDEDVGEIVTSDSVKGETISVMMFGHVADRAEKIIIEKARVCLRILNGGRRRHGH